jgi:hypothetical protein
VDDDGYRIPNLADEHTRLVHRSTGLPPRRSGLESYARVSIEFLFYLWRNVLEQPNEIRPAIWMGLAVWILVIMYVVCSRKGLVIRLTFASLL